MKKSITPEKEPEFTRLCGSLSDRQLAKFFGCAKLTVIRTRQRLGIRKEKTHASTQETDRT